MRYCTVRLRHTTTPFGVFVGLKDKTIKLIISSLEVLTTPSKPGNGIQVVITIALIVY